MRIIATLRKEQHDHCYRLYPYIKEWKKCPYTWLKAQLYMEASAVLVYLLLKTKIKPNTVTIVYTVMGILGGILLVIPSKAATLLAILLFYFRGILDWSDGHYARITEQTSITGSILDSYGARAGWISLWVGLGLNVASRSGMMVFYYLVPLIPALWAGDIWLLARVQLFDKYVSEGRFQEGIKKSKEELLVSESAQGKGIISTAKKMFWLMHSVFEHRARFVDLICLILLIEMFSTVFISWFVFLAFLVWQIVVFATKFCWIAKGGTVERVLQKKVEEISRNYPAR